MKSRKMFSLLFIVGVLLYAVSFIATKKNIDEDPCNLALQNKFSRDTSISNHVFIYNFYNDSLILGGDTTLPADWNKITDTICKIYKDNCTNLNNKPILVVNWRDTARSNWDTRFGKKIFFKLCP